MTANLESAEKQSAQSHTTGSVISKDGTTIGYYQLGSGPGLVILHGSMESAQSHLELGEALADDFTVYLVDRRGRGLSGAHGKDYTIQKEVEDLEALFAETGASYLMGVSSGALVSLQAALTLSAIRRAVIFEPPFIVNGSASMDWLKRYDREMAEGKIEAALVSGMFGAQMGPAFFNYIPRSFIEFLLKRQFAAEAKKPQTAEISMRTLAPTLHYDGLVVNQMAESLANFKKLTVPVLLLGGSKSPAYLKTAVGALENVLPNAERVEFAGLGHNATGNRKWRGQPERVAVEIRRFLSRP